MYLIAKPTKLVGTGTALARDGRNATLNEVINKPLFELSHRIFP